MRVVLPLLMIALIHAAGCGEPSTWWETSEGKLNLKGARWIRSHMTVTLKSSKGLPALLARGIPEELEFDSWPDEELIRHSVDELRAEGNRSQLEIEVAVGAMRQALGLSKLMSRDSPAAYAEKRPDWTCTVADGPISEKTLERLIAAAEFIGADVESVNWKATITVDEFVVTLPGFEDAGIPFTGAQSCVDLAKRWLEEVRKVERMAG
jgi:hypothetical protein